MFSPYSFCEIKQIRHNVLTCELVRCADRARPAVSSLYANMLS